MTKAVKKKWVIPKIKVLRINADTKTGIWEGKKENSPQHS